jgi:esterase/lipase
MHNGMTQIKFTIESEIVAAFKTRCSSEGVSMASVVRQWMTTRQPVKNIITNTKTRPQRKIAVQELTDLLNSIMESESDYLDNIPEQFTQRIAAAEHACEKMGEAIECLEDAF